MQLRVSAYAIVLDDDGRQLLSHWREADRSGWTLPGGGLEPGEDPADAAVREVREETGYDVELGDLLGIDNLVLAAEQRIVPADGPLQGIRILYRARVVGGALEPETDGSTDDAGWFTPAEVGALDRVGLVDTGRRLAGLAG